MCQDNPSSIESQSRAFYPLSAHGETSRRVSRPSLDTVLNLKLVGVPATRHEVGPTTSYRKRRTGVSRIQLEGLIRGEYLASRALDFPPLYQPIQVVSKPERYRTELIARRLSCRHLSRQESGRTRASARTGRRLGWRSCSTASELDFGVRCYTEDWCSPF